MCSEDIGASVGRSGPLGDCLTRLEQWPLREGRQSTHGIPDLTHEQALHRPLPLHRQHTGIFTALEQQRRGKSCRPFTSSSFDIYAIDVKAQTDGLYTLRKL